MQARDVERIGVVSSGWGKPSAAICLGLCLLLAGSMVVADPIQTTVSAADQSARDDERLRILRAELEKSEALADTLARRRAERLAVADVAGADEVEAQRVRTLGDIAGLKREIGATRPRSEHPPAASKPPAAPVKAVAVRASPVAAPWWDVYGKARHADATAPVSSAKPSGDDGARNDPDRRLE